MTEKAALRRSLLTARKSISPDEWRLKSDRLCMYLQRTSLFQQSMTILAYMSFRNEPDLSPLFENHQHIWGIPRCVDKALEWHQWSPHHDPPLQTGAFGILEPDPQWPRLNADHVDLILVPAVACDRHGYRLGYGGGFYDRLFSDSKWQQAPAVGIVFSDMLLDSLPIDPWDYPLNAVCTDKEWLRIRG